MYYHKQNPHGGDDFEQKIKLDFSVNTNPLGTPRGVREAARAALETADRYPDPRCASLVKAIAAYEHVPERYVLCGNGAAELIYAYCDALRPRTALEAAPTFCEYAAAAALRGGRVERFPLREERGFLPGADFAEHVRRTRPEAVFLCDPNNPTGRLWPERALEALLDVCREGSVRLFVDECFLELAGGGSLARRLSEHPELFLLKAFTKTWGMAGLRLGYGLCADEGLLEAMAERTPPWNVSSAAQAAGIAALGEREFLARTRTLIETERPRLKAELEGLGLRVCPSEANFLLFRGPEELGAALRERGIAVRDCANFPGLGPGWYRAAVRKREENERLISAIREVQSWPTAL